MQIKEFMREELNWNEERTQKERENSAARKKNLIKNRKLETIYPDGEKILSRARAYRIFYPSTAIAQKEVSWRIERILRTP